MDFNQEKMYSSMDTIIYIFIKALIESNRSSRAIANQFKKVAYKSCYEVDDNIYSTFHEIYCFAINYIFNLFNYRKRKSINELITRINNYLSLRKEL